MTRSAGDAVIPHSRPGRWRSAGSSVRTPERTGKPVRTACTGCSDALLVEVGKERSGVVVVQRANCQACGSVDDGLQTVQAAAGQAGESDVGVVHFDTTKLEMSVDRVDRGTDRLMLRICRRMPKHVHTRRATSLTCYCPGRRRGRVLRPLVSPEQSQLQVDLTETGGADVVERTI